MPLSEQDRKWAEGKIASGVPKELVFEFLATRGARYNAPLEPGHTPSVTPDMPTQPDPLMNQPADMALGAPGLTPFIMEAMKSGGINATAKYPQTVLPLVGNLMGGTVGRTALGKFITRPVAAGLGQFVGTTGGLRLSGSSPEEAIEGGAVAGIVGGGLEALGNMATRAVGSTISTPSSVVHETMKLSPKKQAEVMFRAPRGAPERAQGLNVIKKIDDAIANLSPGRLSKVSIIDQAENINVRIPTLNLRQAMVDGYMDAGQAVGRSNTSAMAHLEGLERGLLKKFPTGTMTAKEADAQLQAFQRDADMAAARNNPFLAQTYRNLKKTLRKEFNDAVENAMPGSGMAKSTADAKRYMDAVDNLDAFMNRKTPETFIRSLFGGEEASQSAMAALREFEKEIGTGGALEREAHQLALKRAWTQEEVGRAFSFWRFIEKAIAKPATKALIVSHKPAGQAASLAATHAFEQSMRGEK